jgi:hypothetical protein
VIEFEQFAAPLRQPIHRALDIIIAQTNERLKNLKGPCELLEHRACFRMLLLSSLGSVLKRKTHLHLLAGGRGDKQQKAHSRDCWL